jgi:hypothetical protein
MGGMMITQQATAGRIAIVVLGVMMFSLAEASAQTPPPVTCNTYPSGSQWQTIVVGLVDGDCKIDIETDLPMLQTYVNGRAFWDVCNKCGAPVDVKIFDSAPNSLSALFSRFSPMIDASNTSTARNISPGQDGYFAGDVAGGAPTGSNKYAVAVKLASEGEGGWDEFDPELQIDENLIRPQYVAMVIAALLGVAAGFGTGWWMARRRVAQ